MEFDSSAGTGTSFSSFSYHELGDWEKVASGDKNNTTGARHMHCRQNNIGIYRCGKAGYRYSMLRAPTLCFGIMNKILANLQRVACRRPASSPLPYPPSADDPWGIPRTWLARCHARKTCEDGKFPRKVPRQ
jgi:hypothetical protein